MTRLVYLSEHVSTAVLESLVHLQKASGLYPENYQLLVVESASDLPLKSISLASLPSGWQDQIDVTQALGNTWLTSGETAFLRVPSVVAADTWNVLFNPLHPDAVGVRITRVTRHAYDRRLFLIRS